MLISYLIVTDFVVIKPILVNITTLNDFAVYLTGLLSDLSIIKNI